MDRQKRFAIILFLLEIVFLVGMLAYFRYVEVRLACIESGSMCSFPLYKYARALIFLVALVGLVRGAVTYIVVRQRPEK